ncbi:MAG: hypothetical protein HZB47_03675 [Nitrosomonadales bacterium]|nr:hypothetical protein [Nitrosomonadales bacterium]
MTDSSPANDWMELLKPPALPSSEDRLFTSQEDWWNNACVNWCHDGWGLYASGYKDAADLLVQHVEQRSSGQDSLVYPVLFFYRQYLELQIKDIIRQGRRLKDITGDFPKHHHIGNLWEVCHNLLSEISPGDSVVELKEIARLISEFSAVDPSSMAFRYPQDKDGNPSLPGITHINLRNVQDVIGKVSVILMGASAQLGEYLSFKHEMEGEFRGEW